MHSLQATIHCPNPVCQTPNPESHTFCQQCRTLLPKRYLWVVGKGADACRPGELLGGRYFVKHDRIVLDTQPGLMPESPQDIPDSFDPYLRLVPYQLHVPQIYGMVRSPRKRSQEDLLLLEQAPIYSDTPDSADSSNSWEGTLMPELTAVWKQSSALRQLNWLWQMAQLWQPLATEKVAATLLTPELVRVEGSLIRLLELRFDRRNTPTLSDLGQLWQGWQPDAQPEIADFLPEVCQQLLQGQIRTAEQLTSVLDRALSVCGQTYDRQIQIATRTDQGPTRQRNEDACYPNSGTVLTVSIGSKRTESAVPLTVVCDGIGGHEGGSIASNLAITAIQQQLQHLPSPSTSIDPEQLIAQLEQATLTANDVISRRNDEEQRQERQRMGTTLVMALAHAHELYLTHVGDSRAYRISRTGCHQVTLDDDLAAREVRLGYALYREALQQPGSGSLVQALGMASSSALHPTTQRFVLDEDCVFLLCSDGLSDNDRVEQHWQTELLPLLEGTIDIATASQRLVSIANAQNGHDNVTVGLVVCRLMRGDPTLKPSLVNPALATPPTASSRSSEQDTLEPALEEASRTQVIQPPRRSSPIVRLLGIIALWGLGSALAYLFVPGVRVWVDSLVGVRQEAPQPVASTPEASPSPRTRTGLLVGSIVQVNRAADDGSASLATIALLPQPANPASPSPTTPPRRIPVGSVLKIERQQQIPDREAWLKLKVCSIPAQAVADSQNARSGETGWVREAAIAPLVTQDFSSTAPQLGDCLPPSPTAPQPTPSTASTNSPLNPNPEP